MRKSLSVIKNPSKLKENRRKLSIRKKVIGSPTRPRVCALRSNSNIFVQIVDDSTGVTLFSVQTFGKNAIGSNANAESAEKVGAEVAKQLSARNLTTAVFDRNGKKYTGVIAKLADSIRQNGIKL